MVARLSEMGIEVTSIEIAKAMGQRVTTSQCACGTWHEHVRADVRHCSDACKMRTYRERKSVT
jgi:hypothetical protein